MSAYKEHYSNLLGARHQEMEGDTKLMHVYGQKVHPQDPGTLLNFKLRMRV